MGIDKAKNLLTAAELRRHAEDRLRSENVLAGPSHLNEESQRFQHELLVHQVELEMQNEELLQERAEREKMEAQLGTYSDLYDFAPVSYFTIDRDEIIRAANLTGACLLGIERSRLLGRRFGLFITVKDRPLFSAFLEKVFTGPSKEACEMALLKDAMNPLFVQIEAVAASSGRECRVAVIDITERRHAEDALAATRRELEELNSSLEERISRAVENLRQKDQMLILQDRLAVMGEMISNIAHQWKQPLNMLGMVIQQLQIFYDAGEFSSELLKQNTATSMRLIEQMSQTIDDFRNFFSADKEIVAFSVNLVITRTLSLIEKSFQEQGIGIALQAEGDPTVNGYPNEYAQVLLNLLMNARDALVEHKVDDARISLRSFTAGGKTVVTITDNGGGIAEENLGKLFDAYFTTKGPEKGSGIGLFMSKTIIEKSMGGRLTVLNTGSGAEFRIEV